MAARAAARRDRARAAVVARGGGRASRRSRGGRARARPGHVPPRTLDGGRPRPRRTGFSKCFSCGERAVRPVADPYDGIGAFYDAELGDASADAAYFARNTGSGPLLVLGCGTGRICRLLATDRQVTGLDRSASMLTIARASSDRIRWIEGDMRAFDLGTFGEVLLPHGAFAFLHGRADPLACLQACARALTTGGLLTIDLPAPDFALLGVAHSPEARAWQGYVGGRHAHRTREVRRDATALRIDLLDRYFLEDRLIATSLLPLQLALPRELEWLCEAAGFYVDAFVGDYAGGPVRDRCDRIVVRAVRC
ncbi:MAG: class I SAM-dependent methyltransferase [Myxococcales bacterium]|nr:class I SAM-dependent methyltransferase [Myxococcales bacterium]